jgi:hypothetical protein
MHGHTPLVSTLVAFGYGLLFLAALAGLRG